MKIAIFVVHSSWWNGGLALAEAAEAEAKSSRQRTQVLKRGPSRAEPLAVASIASFAKS